MLENLKETKVMVEGNLTKLEYSILKELPHLGDLEVGRKVMLNDVLGWHSSKGRDKYSHFEVSKEEAYFSIYDGEESESIVWDLKKPYLIDQSSELLEWLENLI